MEWKHGEHAIELTEDKRFRVKELERDYDSFRQAEEAAERAATAKAKVPKKKIAIPAIDAHGTSVMITGVHAGTGRVIASPKPAQSWGTFKLYVNVPWIAAAIKEARMLRSRASRIDGFLFEFQLPTENGYGFDSGMYPAAVEKLEREADAKRKKAEGTTLEKELPRFKEENDLV